MYTYACTPKFTIKIFLNSKEKFLKSQKLKDAGMVAEKRELVYIAGRNVN